MRKVAVGIIAAAILLAGILTWNTQATALTGAIGGKSGLDHSLVKPAGCFPGDVFCPDGKMLQCTDPGSKAPNCTCGDCPKEESFFCPCSHPPRPNTCYWGYNMDLLNLN